MQMQLSFPLFYFHIHKVEHVPKVYMTMVLTAAETQKKTLPIQLDAQPVFRYSAS